MNVQERRIIILRLASGKSPFEMWQRAVDARLTRVAAGNFGDHRAVGGGVFELRILKGPGLRVYYGLRGNEVVIVIAGGDKSAQAQDIERARTLWNMVANEN